MKSGCSEFGKSHPTEAAAIEWSKAFFAKGEDDAAETDDDEMIEFPSGFEILFSLISHAIPIPIID